MPNGPLRFATPSLCEAGIQAIQRRWIWVFALGLSAGIPTWTAVAPRVGLESRLLIHRKFLFEAFLTLVERRHVALFVNIRNLESGYGLCALCTTAQAASRQSTGAATCPLRG